MEKVKDLKAFCNEWLSAWTGNQPESLLAFYTEDAFYLDPANKQGLKGQAALLPYFSKLLRFNPQWVWEAVEIMETEKGFTLKWEATIPTPTARVTLNGLDIVELSNGKISRNEVYFDRTDWLKAMQK